MTREEMCRRLRALADRIEAGTIPPQDAVMEFNTISLSVWGVARDANIRKLAEEIVGRACEAAGLGKEEE